MRQSTAAALWFVKYAGGGLVSYGTPQLLVAAGVPLDRWIVAMGSWLSIHMDREVALWAATVITGGVIYVGSVILSKDHNWRPAVPVALKRLWTKVEPTHIIILGLLIAAIGRSRVLALFLWRRRSILDLLRRYVDNQLA